MKPLPHRALALAVMAEVVIGVGLMTGRLDVGQTLGLHAAVVGLLAVGLWSGHRSGIGALSAFAALSIATLGPLGALGAVAVVGLHRRFAARATPFAEWHASLFPPATADATLQLHERIVRSDGIRADISRVAPFADMLRSGSARQKQTVLMLIAEQYRADYAAPLLRTLNDPDVSLRVQAAAAVARIESRFFERAQRLEARRHARPDDADAALESARHHDEHAATGLLDSTRAEAARRAALVLYEQCETLRPQGPALDKEIGRLLLRLGRVEAAVTRLQRAVERSDPASTAALLVPTGIAAATAPAAVAAEMQITDSAPDAAVATSISTSASAATVAWYIESLFRLGRWEQLRETCRRFCIPVGTDATLTDDFRQAVELWAGKRSADGA